MFITESVMSKILPRIFYALGERQEDLGGKGEKGLDWAFSPIIHLTDCGAGPICSLVPLALPLVPAPTTLLLMLALLSTWPGDAVDPLSTPLLWGAFPVLNNVVALTSFSTPLR